MKPLGPQRPHYWLNLGMAKALEVDLSAAIADGLITRADFTDMVTRCRSCAEPEKCRKMLAAPAPLAEAPCFCENAEILQALAS